MGHKKSRCTTSDGAGPEVHKLVGHKISHCRKEDNTGVKKPEGAMVPGTSEDPIPQHFRRDPPEKGGW